MRRNPFLIAEQKGFDAYILGLSINDNPYKDHRKDNGKLTWSRAWRNNWMYGYQRAQFYFNDFK